MVRPFGDYTLLRRLGQGGMAEVFLARADRASTGPKIVVLKRVLPHVSRNRLLVELFLNEARIASRLASPHIARVYDTGRVAGWDYLTMEFVLGVDLARVCARCRPSAAARLGPGAVVRLLADVCAGLEVAHAAVDDDGSPLGIVHGDVHPHNVMIDFHGVAKLIDFGVAQSTYAAPDAAPRGTYAYMAPEQLLGASFDRRADVFAVAAIAWELFAGRPLFRRSANYLTVRAVVEDAPPPLPSNLGDAAPALDGVLARALAKSADDRIASCGDLATELQGVAARFGWDTSPHALAAPFGELFAAERTALRDAVTRSGKASFEDWLFDLAPEVDVSWLLPG
ncbi:MAG: serine/threonine protein kinase [Deltaproteobacteria bacterium]|nr:MAG: serine/threonine protein kinase [Deltaproteobacteria bacterium]